MKSKDLKRMRKILPTCDQVKKIKCPICDAEMEINNNSSLVCHGARRHCYDFASSGYVNLMKPGHTGSGDSKEAVRARRDFLSLDLYRPAADALADVLSEYIDEPSAVVIDAGCGEGYYTSIIAKKGFAVSGVDISRYAAEAAAKRAAACGIENGFFCVGSVYELPFADNSANAVVNVFAPCAETEFSRVLKSGGILAVAYAGPEHLMGLKEIIYDEAHKNDERADMPREMELLEERRIKFDIKVDGNENIQNLFAMTPYYWRTSVSDSEKLKGLDSLNTEVDIKIAVYKKA